MVLNFVLVAGLMLWSVPVGAGERIQPIADELNLDEPFEQAVVKSALRSILNEALDLIEDHIELKGTLQPNTQTGEQHGHLQLKLYPQGKSQSEDHVSAELLFRSSPNDQHLSFDLKLPKDSSQTFPPLPDNTL